MQSRYYMLNITPSCTGQQWHLIYTSSTTSVGRDQVAGTPLSFPDSRRRLLLNVSGLNMKDVDLGISKLRAILPPGVLGFATLTRPLLVTLVMSSSSV